MSGVAVSAIPTGEIATVVRKPADSLAMTAAEGNHPIDNLQSSINIHH